MRRRTGRTLIVLGGVIVVVGLLLIGLGLATGSPGGSTATKADAPSGDLGTAGPSIPGVTPAPTPADTYTPPPPPKPAPTRVHFYCSGNAPGADVSYGSDTDTVQVPGTLGELGDLTPLPFKARMRFDGQAEYYSLDAQLDDGGQVACKIVVTKAGYQPLTVAHCSASGSGAICDAQAAPDDSSGTSWERE